MIFLYKNHNKPLLRCMEFGILRRKCDGNPFASEHWTTMRTKTIVVDDGGGGGGGGDDDDKICSIPLDFRRTHLLYLLFISLNQISDAFFSFISMRWTRNLHCLLPSPSTTKFMGTLPSIASHYFPCHCCSQFMCLLRACHCFSLLTALQISAFFFFALKNAAFLECRTT